jgi:hypothetical protein
MNSVRISEDPSGRTFIRRVWVGGRVYRGRVDDEWLWGIEDVDRAL